ncbi:response regulator transcription factor [Crassaminicella indica]|uniref:Response regulator transcription factor n=1 Tax=Crassaminicella indica TaxID=2855394 RepID=A0ABX8RDW9_9CLOT|nr:response regulator transcription factor [Crassaminicella indica]QXM06617.1 response regulator transcription factor [Crassaminicella indica]
MEFINILVVEDDEAINQLICTTLKKAGYRVDAAMDGEEALLKYKEKNYHMILLDLMIPKIDGIEVMRRIRVESIVPIIILSARDEEIDKILGLRMGADDYMIKPFSTAELLARVGSTIRRSFYFKESSIAKEEKIIYGDISLDVNNYEVRKKGEKLALTRKEFEILKLFFKNPNRVFTKQQIFQHVWRDDYIGDENTVMVHIRRLRSKIEENSSNPKIIVTVWGIGYKLGEIKND